MRIAFWRKVTASVHNTVKQTGDAIDVVVVGIFSRCWGCRGILQTMRFVMHYTHAMHRFDVGNGTIVLEANYMANADFIHRHITITVCHGDHRLDLASQAYRFVIAAATNRVFQ